MKRKIIALSVVFAIVLGFIGLTFILSGEKTVNYGMKDGSITFTEADTDITDFVIGTSGYIVAENDTFALELDDSANPVIRHKATGRVWKGIPDDNGGNSKYTSALILKYFSDTSTEITLYSSENSVDKNQVKVFAADNGVKVEYGFGEMAADYVYPEMISKERMEEFTSKMSAEDADYVLRRYTLYVLDEFEGEDRTYLLSQYPRVEKEDLYVLTSMSTKLMKSRTDEILRNAGYTAEDRDKDNGDSAAKKENPQTFKVAVTYTLTDEGFKATVNTEDCKYYSDYPLTNINILPYFDSFTGNEQGYFVLPSGSGALMKAGTNESEKEISLPVYGSNIALTAQLEDVTKQCTLPIFGQYKNNSGYLCILGQGSHQAEIKVDRNGVSSAVSASFAMLDSRGYTMSSSNPVQLFGADETDEAFSAEYVLLSDLKEDTAYSDMAVYYRNRLIEDGVLTNKTHGSDALLLTEFASVINYDTLALGFIPVNREFATATFEDIEMISKEISGYTNSENLQVLLTGWSQKGLNRQKLGILNFSKAAGGEKRYKALLDSLNKSGIKSYLDINFTVTESFFADGFSKASQASRGLNNSIVKLSIPDSLTNTYVASGFNLVSPKIFDKLWNSYSKDELFNKSGIGVSNFTSSLYGDYADDELFGRKQAVNEITEILKSAQKSEIPVLGDAGNLYSLPYLKLINNLSATSSNINAYYREIPFVQTVLHGYVDYVTDSVNGSENIQKTLLKLIETGSGLHYIVTANSYNKLFETEYSHIYNTNYDALKEEIRENYSTLNKALSGLADKAIAKHQYITDEVVAVSYENGTVIYVNYGSNNFVFDEITVPAMGYCRDDK